MVNDESGLLGVSETSSDVRDLLPRSRRRASGRSRGIVLLSDEEVDRGLRCSAWGVGHAGVRGCIGENAPLIASDLRGLGFLGVELDAERNAKNAPLISPDTPASKCGYPHRRELMIGRSVARVLNLGSIEQSSSA